jgi:catechol 2,3-dioxygenase-like lactoylglutathione lyase family enzyme
VLAPIHHELTTAGGRYDEWSDFGIAQARDDRPVTRNLHVAFVARSREDVDAFWRAGVDAGYESDGEPGPRPQYSEHYYGAFLLDPDGNSAEAVHGTRTPEGENVIDHLWIRVRDVEESRRFWDTVAPVLGLRIPNTYPQRFHLAARNRSFGVLRDERPRTEHVHLAFPAPDDETVRDFHRVALAAGFRDNGAPGERRYHAGYYAAFVLDPDGNNVEAVNHNR